MFELSNEVQSELKKQSKFGIKDEDLKYLVEVIKFLYKKEAKDDNNNVIIDKKTGKPKLVDSLRRSGKPKYTHPYNVAAYLYNKGYSREYIITALFHDVLEDTKYTKKDIRNILEKYVDMYPNAINTDKQEFIDKVINAVDCVTKKGKISRPKAPKLKLKNKIKLGNIEIEDVTVHELLEKKNISRNIGGELKRKSFDFLNEKSLNDILEYENQKELNNYLEELKSILTDDSLKELEQYIVDLKNYKDKMPDYINGIKESENDIARIVKVADRISNLTDFSPTDSSIWLEKYIRETVESFLDLAIGTDLDPDFRDAIKVAIHTQKVKEKNEHGDKGELSILN